MLLCTLPVAAFLVAAEPSWVKAESRVMRNHVRLTSPEDFVKAGEGYFDPTGRWIIMQAVPQPPEGAEPDQHYTMYVSPLVFDEKDNVVGIGDPIRVSAPGSANTCGWFHPSIPGRVLFGSTIVPPSQETGPGYQRGSSKYVWQFPSEMEVVTTTVPAVEWSGRTLPAGFTPPDPRPAEPIFSQPGYSAEGSWSPDGRHVLYANVDEERSAKLGRPDADLWVYDSRTGEHRPLVEAEGYDGGPFFSPDAKWICYRSDRRGDNLLQLFVAELTYNADGAIVGITREIQLTDNEHVNWAPYWHPSGEYLLYATSEVGHHNYEVFAVEFNPDVEPTELHRERVTQAEGFDGLPAFTPDGKWMMWTSQRMPDSDEPGPSQFWIARWVGSPLPVRTYDGQ